MYTPLIELYRQFTGSDPVEVRPIAGSGSNRRYTRLAGNPTLIGVMGTSRAENEAFIYESAFFGACGIPVPRVVAVSDDGMSYLQEDAGSTSLYDLIASEGFTPRVVGLCKKSLARLAAMQTSVLADDFDLSKCYPVESMDMRAVMWDLNYFKYCFLKPVGVEIDEPRLEDEFQRIGSELAVASPRGFMYRDFQSRNILIADDAPVFIDFQGGRMGPLVYDAVSFLYQARAGFPADLKDSLMQYYLDELARYGVATAGCDIASIVALRMLQVLGAYGFRGLVEGKRLFLRHIPAAILTCLDHLDRDRYPEISKYLKEAYSLVDSGREKYDNTTLTVTVTSFSYKKGIPADDSGNGGGFVFDCRAIHNPGRYEPYKHLTGDDEPVIRFLESQSEISGFLSHYYALVDASVEMYMKRGFNSLRVNFGCTGGQHRSVYSATHTARHLNEKYGVRVVLIHREQDKSIILPQKEV